jgi:hypothetical protein
MGLEILFRTMEVDVPTADVDRMLQKGAVHDDQVKTVAAVPETKKLWLRRFQLLEMKDFLIWVLYHF